MICNLFEITLELKEILDVGCILCGNAILLNTFLTHSFLIIVISFPYNVSSMYFSILWYVLFLHNFWLPLEFELIYYMKDYIVESTYLLLNRICIYIYIDVCFVWALQWEYDVVLSFLVFFVFCCCSSNNQACLYFMLFVTVHNVHT